MKKKASVPLTLLYAFVIIIAGLLIIRQQNSEITVLEKTKQQVKETVLDQEKLRSEYTRQKAYAKTNQFVIEKAREAGFQHAGDIRYIITNTELLYDSAEEAQP